MAENELLGAFLIELQSNEFCEWFSYTILI